MIRRAAIAALVSGCALIAAPACTSNPTPYPGQPDAGDEQAEGDGALSPDPNADKSTCERLGGAWVDGACEGATAEPPDADASGGADVDTDATDADGGEVSGDIEGSDDVEPGPG